MSTCSNFFSISSSSWILEEETRNSQSISQLYHSKKKKLSLRTLTLAPVSVNSAQVHSSCPRLPRALPAEVPPVPVAPLTFSSPPLITPPGVPDSTTRTSVRDYSLVLCENKNNRVINTFREIPNGPSVTHRMFSCICLRINAFFLLTSVNHWANSCSSDSSDSETRKTNI